MDKVKLSLCLSEHHAMKAYWRNGSIAPHVRNVGTKWERVDSFTTLPLYPQGKSTRYPFHRRLGGPQNRSGRGGKEKISQPLSGLEPPIIQPIPQRYTTELYER
jgi:hypothetical protein